MHPIGLSVAEDGEVDEAGRVLVLLPDLVAKGRRLVRAYVRDKLTDRREASLQRFGAHLVTRELPNLMFLARLGHVYLRS